jgi:hypothetical protein
MRNWPAKTRGFTSKNGGFKQQDWAVKKQRKPVIGPLSEPTGGTHFSDTKLLLRTTLTGSVGKSKIELGDVICGWMSELFCSAFPSNTEPKEENHAPHPFLEVRFSVSFQRKTVRFLFFLEAVNKAWLFVSSLNERFNQQERMAPCFSIFHSQ